MMHIARVNFQAHGWQWFFRGLTPVVVRAFPVNAVTFLVYETMLKALPSSPPWAR